MIVLETSVLIDGLTGLKRSAPAMRALLAAGERMLLPQLVLNEWLRGPRLPQELAAQEALFPAHSAIAFGPEEAMVSAKLYCIVRRPRSREVYLGIAACALVRGAELWTLTPDDFRDVPGLKLYVARP